jgi:hypothetical protein
MIEYVQIPAWYVHMFPFLLLLDYVHGEPFEYLLT